MSKLKAILEPKNHIQVQVISGGIPGDKLTYDDLTPEDKADLLQDTYDKEASDTRFAPKEHTHEISDIKGLSDELDRGRITLVNLIENGDFSDGTSGWYLHSNAGSMSVENGTLKVVAKIARVTPTVTLTKNEDVYYMSLSAKSEFGIRVEGILTGDKTYVFGPVNQEWERYSTVQKARSQWSGTLGYGMNGLSNGDIYYMKNIIAINLTTTFGKGNEPTKEEMDLLIETLGVEYFEEIAVTKLQSINWLLKLIRQNALATTSLGGTLL